MNRYNGSNIRSKLHKYNYVRTFIIKSILTIIFLLILVAMKKIDLKPTNRFLESLEKNINYNFSFVEDGKRLYDKAQNLINKSIGSIAVFKEDSPKYNSPIAGTVYKSFGQDIIVNGEASKNTGIDIKSVSKMDPKVIIAGQVSNIETRGNKGYFVTIKNENMEIVYGYLSKTYLEKGSIVDIGDIVGLLGTNKDGNQYLRIELYIDGTPVNPLDYIDI